MKPSRIYRLALLLPLLAGISLQGWGCRPSSNTTTASESPGDAERKAALTWVGKPAAGFILPNTAGKEIDISQEIGKRPVVLVFYRGIW